MTTKTKRPEKEIMAEIFGCYMDLSPENVHRDGEATYQEAALTTKKLNIRLNQLFAEIGRVVTESEAIDHYQSQR